MKERERERERRTEGDVEHEKRIGICNIWRTRPSKVRHVGARKRKKIRVRVREDRWRRKLLEERTILKCPDTIFIEIEE